MPHMRAGGLIHQIVTAAPGRDMNLVSTHLVMEPVCIDSGRIDDNLRLQFSLRGLKPEDPAGIALCGDHLLHAGVELELHTVCRGILGKRNRQCEWAHDPACRRIECPLRFICDIRLHLDEFLASYDAKIRNTVP